MRPAGMAVHSLVGGHAMSGGDLLLTCSDCGQEFVFTAGEQQFFQERGYSSPRRCKPCRQAKQGAGQGSGSYAQHESSGGGSGSGTSTTVVCASCGQTTTVPFEPRGDRPVYCKSCYRPKQGGGGGGGGGRQSRGGGGSGGGGGNRDRDRRRY
jgi:CxxC-x17-CxxC domain-containing protein